MTSTACGNDGEALTLPHLSISPILTAHLAPLTKVAMTSRNWQSALWPVSCDSAQHTLGIADVYVLGVASQPVAITTDVAKCRS